MNNRLRVLYMQLEDDRTKLMVELSNASDDKLSLKPTKDKWSINEILTHLVTSEQLTLTYLRKKSLGIDRLKNSGVSEWIRITVLKWSQRIPVLKYRAPKHVVANTPDPVPIEELDRRWNSVRMELKQFLDAMRDEDVRKLIYKHPVAGRFDVIQCLMFMREHFHHHLPQIKRLL